MVFVTSMEKPAYWSDSNGHLGNDPEETDVAAAVNAVLEKPLFTVVMRINRLDKRRET